MIRTDFARAAVIASIPLLESVDRLNVAWTYLVIFVSTTLSICFSSAKFAAIPSLVPRDSGEVIVAANGRIQASYSAAAVIRPLLADALVAFMPIPLLLLVDEASFLVSRRCHWASSGRASTLPSSARKGASSRMSSSIRSRTGGRRRHPGD